MLKILRAQDVLDKNDFEEMVAKIIQSQHFWCTDTELSTFLVANIHMFKTRSEIMKKIEKTFDWLNECPECLIAYYKLRETLCRKDNEDILQDLDDVRLFKMIKHSTRIGTTTLTEILTYNWKCLRICELKYNFVHQLKEFYRKENLVFSKMSFSLILLTQCGEPDLLGYVYKIFKYLNKEKLLYLHSGPEEWNYLLEYTGIDERFVPSHSLVAKRDWLMSILIYIGLESTFCTDEIVPVINRIYDQTKDADLKTMCFRVASAYRHRNGSVIKDFDLIFKNIFDDIKAESGKPCTSNVFLRDINLVLISQFRMFCLLRYDQQFYKYYSSKPEYIEAVTSEIVSNCDAIGDFVIFMDRYDFFVQIFSKILAKECTDSKEKKFVEVCMDRFIGNIYRSLRDKNFDVALYHRLFTKWYEISIAATGNHNLFKFFIYLFVFDVEKVLCAYKGSEKLLDVYKLFKKKTLEIFDKNEEPLSDELCFYSLLIKSDFSTYDVQSLVVSENEQHALTHVLNKMNVYFDRFQNFPACFTKMLRIVKKLHLVNYEMYIELFNFLWLGKNSKEILETLAALLPKVRVKCNIRETFLYDLDWIVILEKLDVKLRREVEEFIIAFYSWLRINNIGELPSYKRTRIRNLADYFGIFLVNEGAKTENNAQPKVKRVKNVPNKFSEEVDSRLEKEPATAYKDDTRTHKKKQPTHQQIGPSIAQHRNADNQPMVTAEVRTERTKKQNVCANFFLTSDATDKADFKGVFLNLNDQNKNTPSDDGLVKLADQKNENFSKTLENRIVENDVKKIEVFIKDSRDVGTETTRDQKIEDLATTSIESTKIEKRELSVEGILPEKENGKLNKNIRLPNNVGERSVKLINVKPKNEQVRSSAPGNLAMLRPKNDQARSSTPGNLAMLRPKNDQVRSSTPGNLAMLRPKNEQARSSTPEDLSANGRDSDIILLTKAEKEVKEWVDPKKAAMSYLGDESVYGRLIPQNLKKNVAGLIATEIKCVSDFYKNVLSFNLTEKQQTTRSQNIPFKFKTYDEYFRVFEPLLLNECRDNLLKGIGEATASSKKYATLVEQASLEDCLELTLAIERTLPDFEVLFFAYVDDNKKPESLLGTGEENYFIGLVVDSKQGSESCVTVRTKSSIKKPKLHGVLVYYDVCCFSSFFREYVALYKLQHFPCLPSVLASDNVKITPLVGDASLVENVILRIHGLNGSQQIAIKNVYTSAAFFSLIHGPPGTGKTKMIVSLIESLFSAPIISALKSKMFITNREPRILICAPSNAAVDELAKRIDDLRMKGREEEKLRVLRIGVQNNIDDNLKMLTLDCIIEKELEERKNRAGLTNFEVTNSERTKRKFELLKRSNVVCATLSSSAKELIKVANIDFDILIIDEACQSVETSTLIPLKFNPTKVVLVGDPKQLPPTVISNCKPYEQSLFVRLQKTYQSVLLNVQYRMHPTIVEFPNQYFYDKRLQTHKSVKKRENPYQNVVPPISFIQVNGEERTDSYFSFYNIAEARYIGNIISELIKNVKNYDLSNKIGIITPYKAQMKKIKEVLLGIRKDILDFVCVNTVDGFQGQEKDVILISTVKSKNIGFLSDLRRINVSITRAKHSLIIIGNTKILSSSNAWKSMLSHYRKKNLVFNHYKSIFIKK